MEAKKLTASAGSSGNAPRYNIDFDISLRSLIVVLATEH
jgi:hypothetical protein